MKKIEVDPKDLIFAIILIAAILFFGLRLARIEAALNSAALAQQVQKNTETLTQVVNYLNKQVNSAASSASMIPTESSKAKK